MLIVEEYQSFPTNTLYTAEDVTSIDPPAFTVCPKPSLNTSVGDWEKRSKYLYFKNFKDYSVSLFDFVERAPIRAKPGDSMNGSTADRESIIPLPNGECTLHPSEITNQQQSDGSFCFLSIREWVLERTDVLWFGRSERVFQVLHAFFEENISDSGKKLRQSSLYLQLQGSRQIWTGSGKENFRCYVTVSKENFLLSTGK